MPKKIIINYEISEGGNPKVSFSGLEQFREYGNIKEIEKLSKKYLLEVDNQVNVTENLVKQGKLEFKIGKNSESEEEQIIRLKKLTKPFEINVDDLDASLSLQIRNALRAREIETLGEIIEIGSKSISETRRIGKGFKGILDNTLEKYLSKEDYMKYSNK